MVQRYLSDVLTSGSRSISDVDCVEHDITFTQDGFLTLVVPIIRHSGGVPVLVHSRRSPPDERDVANEEELWDLRVKVDLQRTVVRRSGELSDGSRETGGSVPSEGLSRRRARRSKGGAPTGKT